MKRQVEDENSFAISSSDSHSGCVGKKSESKSFHIKIILITFSMLFTSLSGWSQQGEGSGYRSGHSFDIAASVSGGTFSGALSWFHLHPLAFNGRLKAGYGLRLTSFVAANKYYTTAPAKYTSPVQNLGTIFSKTIEENIDTITTATAFTNSFNLALYIEYKVLPRWNLGFNIDAIGVSFGPKKSFNIISSSFDPDQQPVQDGSPTRLNVLLTSDNDIGSLNSEFYASFEFSDKVSFRAGFTFLFSEYRTSDDLSFRNGAIVNDRYRYKAGMFLIAATFKPFN